ncbi:velvet factor-domain-containing protein [Mycena capillaripes]|nr:velvet factor-domain-containing protein [Mycena capillaripes]
MDPLDGGAEAQMATHTMPVSYAQDRNRLQYELTVRQEPKQARMCGIGGKADRRPIDPPVIVQLRVIDPAAPPPTPSSSANTSNPSSSSTSASSSNATAEDDKHNAHLHDDNEPPYTNLAGYAQSFLQNPYYFMFASLAKPDDDTELHWLKDGRTRCTTGSVVSSLYALKDPTAAPPPGSGGNGKDAGPTTATPASDAGFFVFPDLSVRTEGSYRLKLSLFEVVGNDVRHCKSIYSAPFYVYTAKKFPGVEESSPLTCSLADQGIKIRIRKDIRMRKARVPGLGAAIGPDTRGAIPMPTVDPDPVEGGEKSSSSHRPAKRMRTDDGSGNTGGAPPVGTPWPTGPLVAIPPPPGAEIQGVGGVSIQGPPNQQQQGMQVPQVIPPPPPPVAPGPAQDMGYDARYAPYDANGHHVPPPHPQQQHPAQQQQQHPGQQQQQQQQHIPPPPPPGYRADAMPPPPPPPPHHGHGYPPQYQHPYYYPPPGPGPYGYADPYAHHAAHHHQQYVPPPPPPHRYDMGYGYPPHPHGHHPGYHPPAPNPYYEPQPPQQQQQQYGEYAQQQAQQQQQQGQGVGQGQGQQGQYGPPPGVQGVGVGPMTPTGMAPNPGMTPTGMAPPAMAAPNPNMAVAPNPNAPQPQRGPPPPPQQYAAYRPYAQPPPPYYGYAPQPQPGHPPQPQQQQQPQHEAHAWGTPPSGFLQGGPQQQQQQQQQQVWGEYAPGPPQVVPSNAVPVVNPNGGGVVGVGPQGQGQGQQGQGQPGQVQQVQVQVQAPQGQVGALRSPNARIELAPLRPREDVEGDERSPTGHAVIQLRSGSAAGVGRGGNGNGGNNASGGSGRDAGSGKKNPLSIGSIISDDNSKH